MRVKIKVTKSDIANGKPNPYYCPIALAVKREAKRLKLLLAGIKVSANKIEGTSVTLKGDAMFFCRKLPKKCRTFVNRFDHDEKVMPFDFTVDIPKVA